LAISRSAENHRAFLPFRWNPEEVTEENPEFLQARLPEDSERILEKMEFCEIEYVFNFAALGVVAETRPEDDGLKNALSGIEAGHKSF
jgi:hypothetical protein